MLVNDTEYIGAISTGLLAVYGTSKRTPIPGRGMVVAASI
jgi:hypothetical protein